MVNGMKTKLGIGVLAGGKSTRMGQNKALLQMNNLCLLKKCQRHWGKRTINV